MHYDFKEILDVGLEIEFSINRNSGTFMDNLYKRLNEFKSVHDASAESPEITIGNIPIQFHIGNKYNKILSVMKYKNLETFGGELNSPIMKSNNFKEHIYKLCDFLMDMGESVSTSEQDNRGSIHVHINVSKDVSYNHLIRFLQLGLATESIFYKLGGMGRVNRGIKNNFVYQRPLTMPPCIFYNGKYYPIFNYKDLLNSSDKIDFFNKYGDTIYQIENNNHYVTQRYMGLNFYSIPFRGSIEFRYCNKTLTPEWIIAWVIFCKSFVNFGLTKKFDESFESKYRKLEDNKDIEEDDLINIFNKFELDDDTAITLLDINRQSIMPEFNAVHILSHLENPTFFRKELGYKPSPVSEALNVDVINVRKIGAEKSVILNRIKNKDNNEVDYVLENNNHNGKGILGIDIDIFRQEAENRLRDNLNNANEWRNLNDNELKDMLELNDLTKDRWKRLGIDVNDYSYEDILSLTQDRISVNKPVFLRFLRKEFWHEFLTPEEGWTINFKILDRFDRYLIVTVCDDNGFTSNDIEVNTFYNWDYRTFQYNFTDLFYQVYNNAGDYFEDYYNNQIEEDFNPENN